MSQAAAWQPADLVGSDGAFGLAPSGVLTFKTWKASRKNVNPRFCLKNLRDLASTPAPPCPLAAFEGVRPAGPEAGTKFGQLLPHLLENIPGLWMLPPTPPYTSGRSGRGDSGWVQKGHPFQSPAHRHSPLGPGKAHLSGDSGRAALAAPNPFSLSFPRLSRLSVYICSILSHQDSTTCRRIRRIETKCGARA